MGHKPPSFANLISLAFVFVGLHLVGSIGMVKAQDANPLLSFDEKAIEAWIEAKKDADPGKFDQPQCLRSEAFANDVGTSCLAQQAMFFLTEVNRRRMIEQKALRRTLQVTDKKRFEAAARAEKAEKTLSDAQVAIAEVAELTRRLETLEKQVAADSQTARDLRETNSLLIEAYESLTDQLHQGLKDTLIE